MKLRPNSPYLPFTFSTLQLKNTRQLLCSDESTGFGKWMCKEHGAGTMDDARDPDIFLERCES